MIKPFHCSIPRLALMAAVLGTTLAAGSAKAQLVLTAAGISGGFSLTNFATGFPNTQSAGPIGMLFPNSGGVLVSDYVGNVRLFATDVDNQLASSAPVGQNYGTAGSLGLEKVGSSIYLVRSSLNDVVQINSNGTFNQSIVTGLNFPVGIVANPNNGHLFVSSLNGNSILDVDPIAKTFTTFKSGISAPDGLSTDGTTLYVEANSSILGYRISDGVQTFNSGFIGGGPDGATLGSGSLAGNIFVNTNGGTFIEVNLTSLVQTVLASSGSRGDFIKVDPNNGSLLITQTDRIQRLTAPAGGGFGNVPEPGTLALLAGLGVTGILAKRRERRK